MATEPIRANPGPISEVRARFMFWWTVGSTVATSIVLPHLSVEKAHTIFLHPSVRFLLLGLWLVIMLEALLSIAVVHDRPGAMITRFLLTAILPPFRAAISTAHRNDRVWLPRWGWVKPSDDTFEALQRKLALPMMGVTLAVIPVLIGEWWCAHHEHEHWAHVVVHLLMALIWSAFVLEFVLSVCVSERKLEYCKFHWINLVIVVIPLLSFLRSVSLLRFLGLNRVPQLLRAFRFRGLFARGIQVALVFDLVDRFMQRDPEKYVIALERRVRDKEKELADLRGQLEEFRAKAAEKAKAELADERSKSF